MLKRFYPDMLWLAVVVLATAGGWLLVHKLAVPDSRAAVEQALRQARPADLESVTVYPLVAGPQPGAARPFQVRTPAQLRALLPALQQLRHLPPASSSFAPLLEATVVVRLLAQPAAAWHLPNRSFTLRLASSSQGDVVQLAQTNDFYQATALRAELTRLRDSLARP